MEPSVPVIVAATRAVHVVVTTAGTVLVVAVVVVVGGRTEDLAELPLDLGGLLAGCALVL